MGTNRISRLWIFDFDGTISDLIPDRDKARINTACACMLERLATTGGFRAAILSSRMLEDLVPRVGTPGVYLGGSHGLIWRFPGGERKMKKGKEELLQDRRNLFIPKMGILERYPGVEIEDKEWSLAVHFRKAATSVKKEVAMILEEMEPFRGIRKCPGPEVIEIPLLPDVDKGFGIRNLCEFLGYDPEPGGLIYSGDDGNDVPAMQWVCFLNGIVFTVGGSPLVAGSNLAATPGILAEEISKLAFGDDWNRPQDRS